MDIHYDTIPDGWVLLNIVSEEHGQLIKVFAGYSGGYLGSDAWKMNSGVTKFEPVEGGWVAHGYSGSKYLLRASAEDRLNVYCMGVLTGLLSRAHEQQVNISCIPMEDALKVVSNSNETA